MACNFNNKWLEESDASGALISSWAKKLDKSNILCCVCEKKVSLQRGKQSILQHSRGDKHKQLYKLKVQQNLQLRVVPGNKSSDVVTANNKSSGVINSQVSGSSQKRFSLVCNKDEALKAELLWTMRLLMQNQSFRSCEGLKDIFVAMFPSCSILDEFSLSETKCRYLASEALGPFFKEKLIEDCQGKLQLYPLAVFIYTVFLLLRRCLLLALL